MRLVRTELAALLLALTFLTVLPLPASRSTDFAGARPYFPLAGWVVGAPAALVLWLPVAIPDAVRVLLALVLWLGATGLLHMDGLVDSADALLAAVSRERRLEILRDVHMGAYGVVVAAVAVFAYGVLLAAAVPWWTPMVASVVARFVVLGPMTWFPPARRGLGSAARGGAAGWLWGIVFVLPVVTLPGALPAVVIALVAALVIAWLMAGWASRRLGGLTGDVHGAVIVLAELAAAAALAT